MKFLLREIQKTPHEYLFLGLVFILAAVLFLVFRFQPLYELIVVIAVSSIYFCWSLYHHARRGDLQFSIVVEYLLLILLAIVISIGTLF